MTFEDYAELGDTLDDQWPASALMDDWAAERTQYLRDVDDLRQEVAYERERANAIEKQACERRAELQAEVEEARNALTQYNLDMMEMDSGLEAENKELNALFNMQQRRMGEAVKLWQDATGKHDTLPDLGRLLDWLLTENAKLREALQFYACTTTYRDAEADALNADGEFFPYGLDDTPISQDLGGKARAVLEES